MTVPLPNAKPVKPTPSPTVKQAPDEARGRTPTKGEETAFGSAIADTGVRGQGFGLSTGGGAGSGSYARDHRRLLLSRVPGDDDRAHPLGVEPEPGRQRARAVIRFTIQRDGTITDATIFKPSGTTTLDTAALRAVLATRHAAAAARRLPESDADHASQFPIPMTKSIIPGRRSRSPLLRRVAARAAAAAARRAAAAAERGRDDHHAAKAARAPRLAVPDFIALSTDAETRRRPRRRSARCSGTT